MIWKRNPCEFIHYVYGRDTELSTIGNEQMKRYHMATSTIPEKIKEGRKVRKVNNTDKMTIFCQGLLHIPRNTSSLSKETVGILLSRDMKLP